MSRDVFSFHLELGYIFASIFYLIFKYIRSVSLSLEVMNSQFDKI